MICTFGNALFNFEDQKGTQLNGVSSGLKRAASPFVFFVFPDASATPVALLGV
jgi:hypothetical protein